MEEKIYHIYDKMFKKILTLSSTAVTNLINGLFETNYPPESQIQYNWTEFEDDGLKKVLADTIITINGKYSYHMEAQLVRDEDIIFRVFEYGFSHANRNHAMQEGVEVLYFPEPKIIYLYAEENVPDQYKLKLDFGSQGSFLYQVPVVKYMQTTPEELTRKKMIILIPFELLKLRKVLEKERNVENLEALKKLIQNDIIGTINKNQFLGNITEADARRLRRLTHLLYKHIYAHYEEMEAMNEMTDESLMLDIDIIEKQHEEELAEKDKKLEEKDEVIAEKDQEIAALKDLLRKAGL